MKIFDFTLTGGLGFSQDVLKFMQDSTIEVTSALAAMGGNTGPCILSGLTRTMAGISMNVSEGWIFYNGEIIWFPAQSYTIAAGVPNILIYPYGVTPPLVIPYHDGTNKGPGKMNIAQFVYGNPGIGSLDDLQPFGREQAWKSFACSVGSGTVYYKKNMLNNTLHIKGSILSPTFVSPYQPPVFTSIGTFNTGYRPSVDTYFAGYVKYEGTGYKIYVYADDVIKDVNLYINNAGGLFIGWIPTATGTYTINFNTIIPLD